MSLCAIKRWFYWYEKANTICSRFWRREMWVQLQYHCLGVFLTHQLTWWFLYAASDPLGAAVKFKQDVLGSFRLFWWLRRALQWEDRLGEGCVPGFTAVHYNLCVRVANCPQVSGTPGKSHLFLLHHLMHTHSVITGELEKRQRRKHNRSIFDHLTTSK